MSDSLTTLIAKVQALLLDDATRFSTATVTAALRQALKEYNQVGPVFSGDEIEIVSGQYIYNINSLHADLISCLGVWKVNTSNDMDTPLGYEFFWEDNQPFIQLKVAQGSGDLLVKYTIPNTINGLDSEVESTVPGYFDDVLVAGGVMHSIEIRATGRIETINLNQDVSDNWLDTHSKWVTIYQTGLMEVAKRTGYTYIIPEIYTWRV